MVCMHSSLATYVFGYYILYLDQLLERRKNVLSHSPFVNCWSKGTDCVCGSRCTLLDDNGLPQLPQKQSELLTNKQLIVRVVPLVKQTAFALRVEYSTICCLVGVALQNQPVLYSSFHVYSNSIRRSLECTRRKELLHNSLQTRLYLVKFQYLQNESFTLYNEHFIY